MITAKFNFGVFVSCLTQFSFHCWQVFLPVENLIVVDRRMFIFCSSLQIELFSWFNKRMWLGQSFCSLFRRDVVLCVTSFHVSISEHSDNYYLFIKWFYRLPCCSSESTSNIRPQRQDVQSKSSVCVTSAWNSPQYHALHRHLASARFF